MSSSRTKGLIRSFVLFEPIYRTYHFINQSMFNSDFELLYSLLIIEGTLSQNLTQESKKFPTNSLM